MAGSEDDHWYPTVEDVVFIHDQIIAEDPDSESGIHNRDQIQFVIDYVKHGHFGVIPESVHEKAFHLLRLLAANHYFVDGNKRTALNTTEAFFMLNGYQLHTEEDIRAMLKLFAIDERLINEPVAVEYLVNRTSEISEMSLLQSAYEFFQQ
jgi:death-on-curing protein